MVMKAANSGTEGSQETSTDNGGGDGDPAPSASLRAADNNGEPEQHPTGENATLATTEKKRNKRRGQPRKKTTGNQREKRRREEGRAGADGSDYAPDWS